jgi:hypothetical protein
MAGLGEPLKYTADVVNSSNSKPKIFLQCTCNVGFTCKRVWRSLCVSTRCDGRDCLVQAFVRNLPGKCLLFCAGRYYGGVGKMRVRTNIKTEIPSQRTANSIAFSDTVSAPATLDEWPAKSTTVFPANSTSVGRPVRTSVFDTDQPMFTFRT